MSVPAASPAKDLRARFGDALVLDGVPAAYLSDATEARGLRGHADAVVLPSTAAEVAEVVAWCYEHDVPITPEAAAPASRAARSRSAVSCSGSSGCGASARSTRCCGEWRSRPG